MRSFLLSAAIWLGPIMVLQAADGTDKVVEHSQRIPPHLGGARHDFVSFD